MESSKCPKCGEEPQYIEHIEKWYCYGCNAYVDDGHECAPESEKEPSESEIRRELQILESEEHKLECKNCGAELEDLKDGKLYCFVCETYQDGTVQGPPNADANGGPSPEQPHAVNEAQMLLETAVPVAKSETPPEVKPMAETEQAPAVEMLKSEPIVDRADDEVPAAADEPTPMPAPQVSAPVRTCPSCEQPLKWIDKYQRHYCYTCRRYAPRDVGQKPAEPVKKACPSCKGELKFVEKYSEWYCYSCKKYSLKEQKKAQEPRPEVLACPKCKGQVKWIDKYARYYCQACKEYAPKGFGGVPADAGEKKQCPACHEAMKFIPEYNEWYCYRCKKYSLRPNKPVLLF